MSDGRLYEDLRYAFTADEIRTMGEALAQRTQELIGVRDAKAAAVAVYNGTLKELGEQIADLSQKVASGYELRAVEVMVLFDTPKVGTKRIIRIDSNQTVREEPMTHAEMQTSFGFSAEPPEEK